MDRFDEQVEAFERLLAQQRAIEPGHYDVDYFASDWRDDGNRYDLDTRRRIEARNPQLILDTFRPQKALDVGCGPGFLMALVAELGVDVDGIDFAESSLTLAPATVRDRIRIAPVTELPVDDRAYDLVICREVLEHLTVLQVRRCVAEVCRASSRFVYITTRFHPASAGLLDVATQFDVDPTHITLLTKGLLRVLVALEGFRRRADLERRLDWGSKERVLVYERVAEG